MKVLLYSTHCPSCNALERQLKQKNINFEICDDINILKEKGFTHVPVLDVEGEGEMDFTTALAWVRSK